MDNVPSTSPDTPTPAHVVEVDGCFGTVSWSVCNDLYGIMPRHERDDVLDMTAQRKIRPFFVTTTDRLLTQVGCNNPSASLDPGWSLETIEIGCEHVGQIFWSIGQGLWDALPADQRSTLLAVIRECILFFFHHDILHPLYVYSTKKLMP